LKNINIRAARDYLALFTTEFYIARTMGGSGIIDIFKKGDELDTNQAKLNGKDVSSFKLKLDGFSFTLKSLTERPSGGLVALFDNQQSLTDGARNILENRAFMDNNFTASGYSIVRVPLPSFVDAAGIEYKLIEDSNKDFYSATAVNDLKMLTPLEEEHLDTYEGTIKENKDYTFESNTAYGGEELLLTVWSNDSKRVKNPFRDEYKNLASLSYAGVRKAYSEWGMPQTPEDEQFYIAMKWPYVPSEDDEHAVRMVKGDNHYGTAQDYKNRKVLVYSPATNTAVCLRPAYYLWGNDNLRDYTTLGINKNTSFAKQLDSQASADVYDGDEGAFVNAVVSPDAAYYLGILNAVNYVDNDDGSYHYGILRGAYKNWDMGARLRF